MPRDSHSIPGTVRTEENGGVRLASPASGIAVSVAGNGGDFEVISPEFEGEEAWTGRFATWDDACSAFADRWLRWVTVTIGLGFHPDTRAEDYSEPLPEPLASEYDLMLSFAFMHLEDPYAVGMDAHEKTGNLNHAPCV